MPNLNEPSDLEGEEPIFTLAVMALVVALVSEVIRTLSAMSAETSACLGKHATRITRMHPQLGTAWILTFNPLCHLCGQQSRVPFPNHFLLQTLSSSFVLQAFGGLRT